MPKAEAVTFESNFFRCSSVNVTIINGSKKKEKSVNSFVRIIKKRTRNKTELTDMAD